MIVPPWLQYMIGVCHDALSPLAVLRAVTSMIALIATDDGRLRTLFVVAAEPLAVSRIDAPAVLVPTSS